MSGVPWTVRLVLLGAPRTKKTSQRIARKKDGTPFILPSSRSCNWAKSAVLQLRSQWAGMTAIAEPVNVSARFYRDARRGDATGYYQALADALQDAGVLDDDKWIESWDGSRRDVDAARPRVEIVITPVEVMHG